MKKIVLHLREYDIVGVDFSPGFPPDVQVVVRDYNIYPGDARKTKVDKESGDVYAESTFTCKKRKR